MPDNPAPQDNPQPGSILNPQSAPQPSPDRPSPDPAPQPQPGGPQGDWRSALPEQYRSHKVFENIKGKNLDEALPTLVKNYVEAQTYIGGAVRIPKATDPPEKWNEFWGKTGRPENPDNYQLQIPMVDEAPLDSEILTGSLPNLHKLGLNNTQMQGVLDEYARVQNMIIGRHRANQKQTLSTLQEEWGGGFARKAVLAQRFAKEFFSPALLEKIDKFGLGDDADFLRAFAFVGERFAEDGIISGQIVGIPGPAEAKNQIAKIMADKNDLYHAEHAEKPGHKERVAEVRQLYQIAYGK